MKKYPTVLSIAGSDSIGGAGIQADIKTCCSIGAYAMTAITALTAQNTKGVKRVLATPADMLRAQLNAIITDVKPDAIKIGMIPNEECAAVIADFLEKYLPTNVVVDPVMVATSGDSLSSSKSIKVLKERILPFATIVTPNLPETQELTGISIFQRGDMTAAAEKIIEDFGCNAVLIKGGHFEDKQKLLTDFFLTHDRLCIPFVHQRIDTINTHGTGCSLSSAIASFLARGQILKYAVKDALRWEYRAILRGAIYKFGKGHGPLNHIFKTIGKH